MSFRVGSEALGGPMRYTYVRELVEGEADGVVEASGSAGAIDVGGNESPIRFTKGRITATP